MFEGFVPAKRMAQVVEAMTLHFAKEHNLQHLPPNDLFETFTAYCMVKKHTQDFEPVELRMGGPGDLGIDACAVIIDGAVFTDPAEVADYVAIHGQIQVRFVVVQAKRTLHFDGHEFAKLATGVARVFNTATPLDLTANKAVLRIRECAEAIYGDPKKFEVHGLPCVDVWYATLGRYRPVVHQAQRAAAYALLDGTGLFRRVEVSGAGARELRNAYRDLAPGLVATLKLPKERRVEVPSSLLGIKQTFVGVVRARDLVDDLLLDENRERRFHLYDENLRDFLTERNPVNTEIEETLTDDAMRGGFAVLNNGVTIVVGKLMAAATEMVLRGPRVVNGCQTCNVLATNRDKLTDDVMVNVRVIESLDPDVVTAIVIATNRQTVLTPDMFDGRAEVQKDIEDVCASHKGREVYFARRLNQYGARKVGSQVINRRHMVQSFGAMWLGVPDKVFAYRSLAAGKHGAIFAKDHDPLSYYLAASAYVNLGRVTGSGKGGVTPQYRPALFHLVHGLRLLAFGAGLVHLKGASLETASQRLLDVLWDLDRLRGVLNNTLLPAVNTALDGRSLTADLGAAVREGEFTERFRRAVLERPAPEAHRLLQAA